MRNKKQFTDCSQKLLIVLLTLKLILPSESHDGEREETKWGRSL